MRAIMQSIKPKYCELIASGKKTIEVRKTKPKCELPIKVYIYCTKDNMAICPKKIWWKKDIRGFEHIMNGEIIGEYICNNIDTYNVDCEYVDYYISDDDLLLTGLDRYEFYRYGNGVDLYGYHISDLKIYDRPKEMCEFGLRRPPQSWQYVKELNENDLSTS